MNPDLTLPGYPEVFVVGDMIDLDHLPGVAQVAIQGAKYAAKEIKRRLAGKPPQKPFHYFDKGRWPRSAASGRSRMIGRLRLTGFVAWLLWLGVHLLYLTGFKNRCHRAAALGGLVHRPRSVRADLHRAADLRAPARSRASRAGRPDLVSSTGEYDGRDPASIAAQRRGRSSRSRRWPRSGSPTPASAGQPTR